MIMIIHYTYGYCLEINPIYHGFILILHQQNLGCYINDVAQIINLRNYMCPFFEFKQIAEFEYSAH